MGSQIEFVGRNFAGNIDRQVDYGNALIGPGFIDLDALGDLDTTVLTFDNGPEWKLGRIWSEDFPNGPRNEAYTPEEETFKYRYAFTQLIRNGITTAMPITSMLYRAWAETYKEFSAVADIAGETGIRAYLGPCYMSGLTYVKPDGSLHQHFDEESGIRGLNEAIQFFQQHDGTHQGRVKGFFAPDRIETQVPAILAATAQALKELDAPMRIHCCQSSYEFETVLRLRGKTPYGWLEEFGLLNERAILPHGIYVSGHPDVSIKNDDDLARLAASGASVVHCPIVFGRDGEALASFGGYRNRGINLALGTDTFPPDIIDNMRQGLAFAHLMDKGKKLTSAADFYEAATLGGAKALRRGDLGRLSPGAKADITVFDLSGFHLGQIVDPIKTMVLAGSGRDFRASYIDGVAVMKDYKVIGCDEKSLSEKANAQFHKVIIAHADRAVGRPNPKDIFKPSLPIR